MSLFLQPCAGSSGDPCCFSTEHPGKPEQVSEQQKQCVICKHAEITSQLAANLSQLYILDYEFYLAALDRFPVDEQRMLRSRVGMRLKSMCPATTTRLRRTKLLSSVNHLLASLVVLPQKISSIAGSARSIFLLHTVRMRKRFAGRRLPLEVFQLICDYLMFDQEALSEHLHQIRHYGYSLCRHPVFRRETSRTDELSDAYRNAVKVHKDRVADLGACLIRASRLLAKAHCDRYRCASDVAVAISIGAAPELKDGTSVAHSNFHPRQLP